MRGKRVNGGGEVTISYALSNRQSRAEIPRWRNHYCTWLLCTRVHQVRPEGTGWFQVGVIRVSDGDTVLETAQTQTAVVSSLWIIDLSPVAIGK